MTEPVLASSQPATGREEDEEHPCVAAIRMKSTRAAIALGMEKHSGGAARENGRADKGIDLARAQETAQILGHPVDRRFDYLIRRKFRRVVGLDGLGRP